MTTPALSGSRRRVPRRQLAYAIAFYLGIPVLLALHAGATEAGSATFVAKRYYFYYFLLATIPCWWAIDVATRVAQRVLKPWSPPLLLVLVIGAILGLHLQGLWTPWRQSLFEPYLAEGSSFYPVFPWRYDDPDYLVEAVVAWTMVSALWAGANLIFIYMLKVPRLGVQPRAAREATAAEAMPSTAEPAPDAEPAPHKPAAVDVLFEKLPERLGRHIVALKAEEHYTRVFTETGETLVRMRFSDAVGLVRELEGVQTHRSWWVNPEYVGELVREGRTSHVDLTTGLEVPVSRSFRVKVQETLDARPAV